MRRLKTERTLPMELRLPFSQLARVDEVVMQWSGDGAASRSSLVRRAIDAWREAGAPVHEVGDRPRRRLAPDQHISRVTVYLAPEHVAFLDDLADRKKTTRSELIRSAVAFYLRQIEQAWRRIEPA